MNLLQILIASCILASMVTAVGKEGEQDSIQTGNYQQETKTVDYQEKQTPTTYGQINAGKKNQNELNEENVKLMNSLFNTIDPATTKKIIVSDENKSRLREALMEVDEQSGNLSADEITKLKMKVMFEYMEKIYVYKKTKEIAAMLPTFKDQDPEVNLLLGQFYEMSLKNVYADVKENLTDFLKNLLASLKPYWEKIKNLFKPQKMVENSVASVIDTLKEQNPAKYKEAIEQANSNNNNLSPTNLGQINADGSS